MRLSYQMLRFCLLRRSWGIAMSWSGLFKVFTGLFLAIALLAGGGLLAAQFFIAKLSAPPTKPIYSNDKPVSPVKATLKPKALPDQLDVAEVASKPLPSGAYEGRVTQSIGLILRDAPGRDSGQTGGIDYNEKVIVLETSSDGEWQKVKVQSTDKEGWVKAGNTEKTPQ